MADNKDLPANEEEAAAAWGDMAGGGDAAAAETSVEESWGGETDRVLDQSEIDMLLGFDGGDEKKDNNTGIHAILDRALMAYEKMPMLEVVFDRMVRGLSSTLRNFTSENVDVSLDSMTSLRFDDYLNSIPLPALLVVFRAVEWENYGIVTVDSSQIYSMVDVLFGGRKSQKPVRIEGRPYTTIEQDIVRKMVDIVLSDMSQAFDPVSPVTFQFDRMENNPRFATITRPNNAALLVRMRVEMEERGGVIEILLPHNTLEPIRDMLLQMFMGEKFGQDTVWERHFGTELRQTGMDVEVVLDEMKMALGDVVNLKVGNTIMLKTRPGDEAKIKCGGVSLTTAKVGRIGDTVAVSLSHPIQKEDIKV